MLWKLGVQIEHLIFKQTESKIYQQHWLIYNEFQAVNMIFTVVNSINWKKNLTCKDQCRHQTFKTKYISQPHAGTISDQICTCLTALSGSNQLQLSADNTAVKVGQYPGNIL